MDNQKMNTERLIASFENNSSNWVSVYESKNDKFWNHYYDLTGYFKNLYFHVVIMESIEGQKIEVSKSTNCKQEIEALLIKFNLV